MVVLPCPLQGRGALHFFASSFTSCMSFSPHGPTSMCSTAVGAGARGLYKEVKTVVKKIMYDALKRVLPNPRVEPVNLSISK